MVKNIKRISLSLLLIFALLLSSACSFSFFENKNPKAPSYDLSSVPPFGEDAVVVINDGKPYFTEDEYTTKSFESYSDLDALGRCGVAYACVGRDLMPTDDRESISSVKPSGWQTAVYDHISGKYLYNRCHLIGFQLTGENANEKNLITGTRYLNIEGMLPFENMVADYVKETGHHVLYRVTPIFEGDELVARGVLMEGYSVEDNGEGVNFCVYAYNNQPGVTIDYATGKSHLSSESGTGASGETLHYVLNMKSKKFHLPTCSGAASITEENRAERDATREELIAEGYEPCGTCKP